MIPLKGMFLFRFVLFHLLKMKTSLQPPRPSKGSLGWRTLAHRKVPRAIPPRAVSPRRGRAPQQEREGFLQEPGWGPFSLLFRFLPGPGQGQRGSPRAPGGDLGPVHENPEPHGWNPTSLVSPKQEVQKGGRGWAGLGQGEGPGWHGG